MTNKLELADQLNELQKEYYHLSRDYVLACRENARLTNQINEKHTTPTKLKKIESFVKKLKSENYTIEEWQKCANELCKNGVGRGCYQDYHLLTLVMSWLEIMKSIY